MLNWLETCHRDWVTLGVCTGCESVDFSGVGNWTFGWIALQNRQCQEGVIDGREPYGAVPRCYHLIFQGHQSTRDPPTEQRDNV